MPNPNLHCQFFSEIVEENESIEKAIHVRPLEMILTVISEAADHAVFDWCEEHVPDFDDCSMGTSTQMDSLRYHKGSFGKEAFSVIIEVDLIPKNKPKRKFRFLVRIEADKASVQKVL